MGDILMNEDAFSKFYLGFLFVMIDFRLQGVDILPDIIGYWMFAGGLSMLASKSGFFEKARSLNMFMIILSIFQIYERPAQGSGINFGLLGPVGFLIGIAATILSLIVIYNLFMGIKDMARLQGQTGISEEAEKRWVQYLVLQLAGLLSIVLLIMPPLAMVFLMALFILSIVLVIATIGIPHIYNKIKAKKTKNEEIKEDKKVG
jgi:hypothetical protein